MRAVRADMRIELLDPDELGIGPFMRVRRLQHAMLSRDPAPEAA